MLKFFFTCVFLAFFTFSSPVRAETGRAMEVSWYGAEVQGNRMANGKRFDMNDATIAAHRHFPFGTRLQLTDPDSGRSILVIVQDRGPFVRGRDLDVSKAAAQHIGILHTGVKKLLVNVIR